MYAPAGGWHGLNGDDRGIGSLDLRLDVLEEVDSDATASRLALLMVLEGKSK
jgi:hypothetical protein